MDKADEYERQILQEFKTLKNGAKTEFTALRALVAVPPENLASEERTRAIIDSVKAKFPRAGQCIKETKKGGTLFFSWEDPDDPFRV